jgi:hypothetical protein
MFLGKLRCQLARADRFNFFLGFCLSGGRCNSHFMFPCGESIEDPSFTLKIRIG